MEVYLETNKNHIESFSKLNEYMLDQIKASGMTIVKVPDAREIKSTIKFDLSHDKAQSLASAIQIQYLPNTHQLVGLKTYSQIVESSFELSKG